MSDSTGQPVGGSDPSGKPYKKDTKNIPPLVWIVLAAVIILAVVAVGNWRSTHKTPNGHDVPAGSEASTSAPLTSTPGPSDSTAPS